MRLDRTPAFLAATLLALAAPLAAAQFNQISAAEDTKQFLANSAFDPFPGTPEQMQSLLKSDAERWKRYVELAKIEPQ